MVLPGDMQVAEVGGFIFDGEVAEEFGRYLAQPSTIVDGDRSLLEIEEAASVEQGPVWLDAAPEALFSLETERRRWAGRAVPLAPDGWYPRALTGTLVGGYFHHQQCQRWLRLQFVPPKILGWEEGEVEWGAERMAAPIRAAARARLMGWRVVFMAATPLGLAAFLAGSGTVVW